MIRETYRDIAMVQAVVHKWFRYFKSQQSLKDDTHKGIIQKSVMLTRPCIETFFTVCEKISAINVFIVGIWKLAPPHQSLGTRVSSSAIFLLSRYTHLIPKNKTFP
jgi:hypothetical protein